MPLTHVHTVPFPTCHFEHIGIILVVSVHRVCCGRSALPRSPIASSTILAEIISRRPEIALAIFLDSGGDRVWTDPLVVKVSYRHP
jgi:hypothetical protein